ncbi:MAG: SDR family NAD(P)-dependent oxidoreductase [Myxococcota bacterium]
MRDWLRERMSGRPLWMNALLVFSAYMAFVYVPWDLFVKPVLVDEEVWFGVRFHGWTAKLLTLPHWFVYAAGAYGFWRMRPWMWPWASVYTGQVAIGMLVWPIVYQGGIGGLAAGIVSFAVFGSLTVALWRARERFERPAVPLSERYGGWAVVTGASAGIGSEFARRFAREGLPVVLAARREDRLKDLATELEREHGVETRAVAVDLAAADGADRLAEAVADLDVGVVVNNAGFGYAGAFAKLDTARLRDMVQLNCLAPVVLTSRLLPRLLERGRGAVIVVGSIAGNQPLPLHGVYGATKAFDRLFGESLWGELRGSGVDALVLEPGSTTSEFHQVAGELPHAGAPAADVVRTALDALGQQPSVIHGWGNWIRAVLAARLLPRSWQALVAKGVIERQTPEGLR